MQRNFVGVLIFLSISVTFLVITSVINFDFFHMVTDLSVIFLGMIIFIIAFYSSEYTKGSNLLFVGVAYLFISLIDLMHMVNSGDFNSLEIDLNISAQLWIAARFVEGSILYLAYSMYKKASLVNFKLMLASFGITTLIIFAVVSLSDYLPLLYNVETGFTLYKQVLDGLVIGLFILAFIAINKNESRRFNKKVLLAAIAFKVLGEFVFIFESTDNHIFVTIRYISKYISYVLLFLVFARDLLQRPYENIFRAFKEKEDELTELSRKDSLTGLYNHSTSYEIMREIIKKNEINKVDTCLLMIDIDDFKCINDKYGHTKGDEILFEIANIFKNCEGPIKLAGRYGGDEFVVLFDNCNVERAKKITERIFTKMEILSDKVSVKVTLSIGISEWKSGFTAKDLVNSADYQMYESKSIGKNTYSVK